MFAQQGWKCPECGRIYAPHISMCFYCGGHSNDWTIQGNEEWWKKIIVGDSSSPETITLPHTITPESITISADGINTGSITIPTDNINVCGGGCGSWPGTYISTDNVTVTL